MVQFSSFLLSRDPGYWTQDPGYFVGTPATGPWTLK